VPRWLPKRVFPPAGSAMPVTSYRYLPRLVLAGARVQITGYARGGDLPS
jgi:hypothetical protein